MAHSPRALVDGTSASSSGAATLAIRVAPVAGDAARRTPAGVRGRASLPEVPEEERQESAEGDGRWARPPAGETGGARNGAYASTRTDEGAEEGSFSASSYRSLLKRNTTVSMRAVLAQSLSHENKGGFLNAAQTSKGALGRTITKKEAEELAHFDYERAAEQEEAAYAKSVLYKLCMSVGASVLLQIVQVEFDVRYTFDLGKRPAYLAAYVCVGVLVTLFNILNAHFLFKFYRAVLHERVRRKYAAESATVRTSGMFDEYVRNAAFLVLHAPTWVIVVLERILDTDILEESKDARMMFLIFGYLIPQMKILMYLFVFRYTSSVITDKLRFLAKLNKVDVGNVAFGMRVQLELYPFTFISVTSLLNVILAAHNVSLCERVANCDEISSVYLIDDFSNPFEEASYTYRRWLFHVFSNNFGGNDITHPRSSCGQAVVAVSLLVGVVLLSILVAVLTRATQLKPHEEVIIKLARLDMLKLQMRHAGSVCLQRAWRAKVQKWGKQNLVYSFNNALWMLRSVRLAENEERRRLHPPSTATLELIWQLIRTQSEFEERMREALGMDPLKEDTTKPASRGASTKRMGSVGDLSQDGSPRYPNPLTDAPGTHDEMCQHFASYLREDPRVPSSVKAAIRNMGGLYTVHVGAL